MLRFTIAAKCMHNDTGRPERLPFAFLLLLVAALLVASGCRSGEKRKTFSPQEAELLSAKGDDRLRKVAESGETDPFAAIAVFRSDVFLDQSEALAASSYTVLNEMGNCVVLNLSPGQIVPLLQEPSLRRLAWFGPQGRMARLEPSLEIAMMSRFGAGTEKDDVDLLLRLTDVGGAAEERHVADSGFRVETKAGPTWIVTGPMAGIPKLLESDRIIYIEGASQARTTPR